MSTARSRSFAAFSAASASCSAAEASVSAGFSVFFSVGMTNPPPP